MWNIFLGELLGLAMGWVFSNWVRLFQGYLLVKGTIYLGIYIS
jgi:hypothetical protein